MKRIDLRTAIAVLVAVALGHAICLAVPMAQADTGTLAPSPNGIDPVKEICVAAGPNDGKGVCMIPSWLCGSILCKLQPQWLFCLMCGK